MTTLSHPSDAETPPVTDHLTAWGGWGDEVRDDPFPVFESLRAQCPVHAGTLADGHDAVVCGILQHIEEAGIHSGDSAAVLPPWRADPATLAEMERIALRLAARPDPDQP